MTDNTEIEIREGTVRINPGIFSGRSGLKSVTIPGSLTSIGNQAFNNCSALETVIINEGVTNIGSYAFYNCKSLSSLTIPSSVTSIGDYAFYYALDTELARYAMSQPSRNDLKVYISDLAAWCNIDFGTNVFSEINDKYTYSEIWLHLACIQRYSLYLNDKYLSTLEIPEEITAIKPNTFAYCNSISTIKFHDGVTSIGNNAFRFCYVSSISGGKNIKTIGDNAFEDSHISDMSSFEGLSSIGKFAFAMTRLNSIVLPNTIESLGNYAFWSCTGLSNVVLSEPLKKLPNGIFSGCTSLKHIIIPSSVTAIESSAFEKCDNMKYLVLTSETFPTFTYYNYKFKVVMLQSAYEKGIPESVKNFVTYSNTPVDVEVVSKGAVSAVFNVYPINDDGSLDEENMATVTTHGQTPGQYLNWKKAKDNYGVLSEKANETLTLIVQQPKELSTTKARLLATVEEADDVEHFGFEWRRIESSEMISSKIVSAPLYNGTIVGTLNNLKDDVEYKYRPFYKSDAGEIYYGEWMGLFTGDADVYFEPEVYTKDATDITKVSALLAGLWFEGTDDFEEKGFEYWTVSEGNTRAIGADVKTVVVTGNKMTATLEDLQAGKEYGFRSYAKTASGTTYGEEKTFKTILVGDVNGDGVLDKKDIEDLADYIIGKIPTNFNVKMANLNDDTRVDAVDIVLLVQTFLLTK